KCAHVHLKLPVFRSRSRTVSRLSAILSSMERLTAIACTSLSSNYVDVFPGLRATTPQAQSCGHFVNVCRIDDASISRVGPPCNAEQFLGGGRTPTAAFVVRSVRNFSVRRVAARATNEVPSRTQIWTAQRLSIPAMGVRSPEKTPARAEAGGLRCCSRRTQKANRARLAHQGHRTSSPRSLRGCLFLWPPEDFVSGEVTSREEFEAWSAAAAAAAEAAAAEDGSGCVRGAGGFTGGPTAAVPIEQVYSARASPSGISWVLIVQTVLDQLLFLGFFAWLATPAIRTQLRSLFVVTFSGAALGALGAVPMFVYGLHLGTRHWPWLKTSKAASVPRERVKLFGRRRQVARVAAVSASLALLVGFCEECVYRGLVPLLLAAKTGLPLAAIVGISAIFCGARHAGTLGSAFDAAVLGIYVHCILLLTGNLLVPIIAHAVFDGILFIAEHVEVNA
ncbi:unnamed protein product, partial [Scytosiphon promiscuus]